MPTPKPRRSRPEAAQYLTANGYPVKSSTLAEWASSGRNSLAFEKIAGEVFYRQEDLDAFLRIRGLEPADGASPAKAESRLIRRAEVERITGLSRTTLYRLVQNSEFPAPVSIGARAVAWNLALVLAWVDSRPSKRASA